MEWKKLGAKKFLSDLSTNEPNFANLKQIFHLDDQDDNLKKDEHGFKAQVGVVEIKSAQVGGKQNAFAG